MNISHMKSLNEISKAAEQMARRHHAKRVTQLFNLHAKAAKAGKNGFSLMHAAKYDFMSDNLHFDFPSNEIYHTNNLIFNADFREIYRALNLIGISFCRANYHLLNLIGGGLKAKSIVKDIYHEKNFG